MRFIFRRLLRIVARFVLTLVVITVLLYGSVMLTPAETRATLYMPKNTSPRMTEEKWQELLEKMIERYELNAPFHVQYLHWLGRLVQGNWGYSPTLQEDVFSVIIRRTPATAELTLLAFLIFIPLGLLSGVVAASKKNRAPDHAFRLAAFVATSLPPMIFAILLMVIFYIDLYWFAPGRLGTGLQSLVSSAEFKQYTGFLTIDGLLNHVPQVSVDALRHLAMPALTLAIAQWSILGRLTRALVIEESQQEYVAAARARGLPERKVMWNHALRNALPPLITNSMLSAATMLTGIFVVEILFNIPGVSSIAVKSMAYVPDAPAALGFAIYSVVVVLLLMSVLDLIQVWADPRLRWSS